MLPVVQFLDGQSSFPPPIIQSFTLFIAGNIAGMSINSGLLFLETDRQGDKLAYRWIRSEDELAYVGRIAGIQKGTGRFFFLDSLTMFSSESFATLGVFQFKFQPAGVESIGSINQHDDNLGLQVFPNIVSDHCSILIHDVAVGDNITLRLYDARGQEIQRIVNTHVEPGTYSLTLNTQMLAPGSYFLQLTGATGNITQTIHCIR
jgi:hypothetical protein